ncbi:MAG TPA: hypothetical protein VJQ09_06740 [Candidatus Limnocylindria bacterium]|nr:hypothetical protein [Candidatus Limnocylindria bacterium]
MTLDAVLAEARALAAEQSPDTARAAATFERVIRAAAASDSVRDALRDVSRGRALLRFTDSEDAFEFGAGEGALSIERADKRGPGPKVDATSATWLRLMAGTIKPWLAFTRGLVVCRAGLNELRWMQQVAERIQSGYARAR